MKKAIPSPPGPCTIDEVARVRLEKWITWFKTLSPRIRITVSGEKTFDLDAWLKIVKQISSRAGEQTVQILDWPNKNQALFLVSINSCLVAGEERYLPANSFLFCIENRAFGFDFFQRNHDSLSYVFSLPDDNEELTWEYIASIVKERIEEIEQQIPQFNQNE